MMMVGASVVAAASDGAGGTPTTPVDQKTMVQQANTDKCTGLIALVIGQNVETADFGIVSTGKATAIGDARKALYKAADVLAKAEAGEASKNALNDLEAAKQKYKDLQAAEAEAGTKTVAEMTETAGNALTVSAATLSALRTGLDQLKDFPSFQLTSTPPITAHDYLHARENLLGCAKDTLADAKAQQKKATASDDKSASSIKATQILDKATTDYVYVAQQVTFDKPQLSLLVGPSFAVNGSDKLKTGAEITALFDGGAGSFFNLGRVITEFRYVTKGSVDASQSPPPTTSAETIGNVIKSDVGYLRFNAGASTSLGNFADSADRYSLAVVGGLSTAPGNGGDFPAALRPRGQISLLGRTFVSDTVYTRLTAGWAYDSYWRNAVANDPNDSKAGTHFEKAYRRAIVQGLVVMPNLSAGKLSAAARITLDTPTSGRGPSEVRLSVLANVDFLDFFHALNPVIPGSQGN